MINNKDQIIKYFEDGIKEEGNLKIGVEHEKFIFNTNIDFIPLFIHFRIINHIKNLILCTLLNK